MLQTPDARPDAYGPFIRVTNSYNGLRALTFDIGFYRKVCKNGLVLPGTVISFKFSHVRDDLGSAPQFDIQAERISKLQSGFGRYVDHLRAVLVPRLDFEPLMRVALSLRPFTLPLRYEGENEDYAALDDCLATLSNRYASDLGENAYAVFNAITDFASHPLETKLIQRERQSLQRSAGGWLVDFSQCCKQPDFKLDDYIATKSTNDDQPKKANGRPVRGAAELTPA